MSTARPHSDTLLAAHTAAARATGIIGDIPAEGDAVTIADYAETARTNLIAALAGLHVATRPDASVSADEFADEMATRLRAAVRSLGTKSLTVR